MLKASLQSLSASQIQLSVQDAEEKENVISTDIISDITSKNVGIQTSNNIDSTNNDQGLECVDHSKCRNVNAKHHVFTGDYSGRQKLLNCTKFGEVRINVFHALAARICA